MAIASIEELFKGICELAGVKPPVIEPDASGARGATLRMRCVDVAFQQFTDRSPDTVFLAVALGDLPDGRELAAWHVLLEANLHMVGEAAPIFCKSPVSGRPVLQWACPLMEATVADTYQRVLAMIDVASRWRSDRFLDDAAAAYSWFLQGFGPQPLHPEESKPAHTRFDELYRGICRALGQPDQQIDTGAGVRGFPLQCEGVDLRVMQSTDEGRDLAFLVVPFGPANPQTDLQDSSDLMELNFRLATENRAARIAHDPIAGEALLIYACPLSDTTPQQMLADSQALAKLALEWQLSPGG